VLELLHLVTEDELLRIDNARYLRNRLVPDSPVLRIQIQKRYRF